MESIPRKATASHIMLTLAAFVIVVAGMRAATSILVPFLLAAFIGSSLQTLLRILHSQLIGHSGGPPVIKQIQASGYMNPQSWFTHVITLSMAGSILLSATHLYHQDTQNRHLLTNPFLLAGKMTRTHHRLTAGLDETTRVLAWEAPWLKAFSEVGLDNVFHVLYLPPFKDASGGTEAFLAGLDVIWVSDHFARKVPSVATQIYLRYALHVAPFLNKALLNGWYVETVEGFGKIYCKPIKKKTPNT